MKNNILTITSRTGRHYIFDAISNNIYETDGNCDIQEISLKDLGYTSDLRENPLSNEDGYNVVQKNAKTLIIELTEECNFRCKYCIFDEDNKQERNHSEKKLSIDCAKSNIEQFYSRTDKKEAYVIFYGGEPLLEFKMLQELVEHGNKISNKNFKYSLTTNGVLLTKQKIDFLVENNFIVTVSIDGPQNIHDLARVSKNGKATHRLIEGNLQRIKTEYPSFFEKNILVNCTICNDKHIDEINDYFSSSSIFSGKEIRFSPVISKEIELNKKIDQKISLEVVKNSLSSNIPAIFTPVQQSFFGDVVKKIQHRKLDKEAKQGKKICIPFSNRTYLRSNGTLQFCERIETYGLLETNTENLLQSSVILHNDFKSLKENDCAKCFAYNFCEMCPASFISNGKLDYLKSVKKCDQFRNVVKVAMKFYIEQGENNE